MSSPERAHTRYAHEAAVTFSSKGMAYQGRTTNLSRGGLCADLADSIEVGREVEINLQLVFDDDSQSEALQVPGRVAWCTTVDEAFQVGISFRPMDAERANYLMIFLRFLDDGVRPKSEKRTKTVDERFG